MNKINKYEAFASEFIGNLEGIKCMLLVGHEQVIIDAVITVCRLLNDKDNIPVVSFLLITNQ